MDPVLKAVLMSWDWRLDVILVLVLAGTLYIIGWRRLRERRQLPRRQSSSLVTSRRTLITRWRLVAYLLGLLSIALALLSPIDVLGGQLFFIHMIQHMFLMVFAPPLLLIANPLPFILWGLPTRWRRGAGNVMSQLLHKNAPFRRALQVVTSPGVVWMFWVISVIGWHDPNAYTAALRSPFVHDLEHLNFFLAGMLFWWHVIGAGPRIHKRMSLLGRIALVIAVIPPNMLTGVVIAFAREPIYSFYTAVPRLWGISVMADQQLSGVIMWVPGSMMYLLAALVLIAQLLRGEASKPSLPESAWATDEALVAPGLEK